MPKDAVPCCRPAAGGEKNGHAGFRMAGKRSVVCAVRYCGLTNEIPDVGNLFEAFILFSVSSMQLTVQAPDTEAMSQHISSVFETRSIVNEVPRFRDVKLLQFLNSLFINSTFSVLNMLKYSEVNDSQRLNMPLI